MNKEVLINPKTGKSKNCWSLDVPGLLADGWERPGANPGLENKDPVEPIQAKPKRKTKTE